MYQTQTWHIVDYLLNPHADVTTLDSHLSGFFTLLVCRCFGAVTDQYLARNEARTKLFQFG